MAGNAGTSGADGLNGPENAKDAGELAGGGAAAGGAAAGWSETRPFLPGQGGGEPPETAAPSGGEKWRYSNQVTSGAGSRFKGVIGKVVGVVAAHSFVAGAAILVSVVAFGATGVALLNSTKDKGMDNEVATIGLGDKDSDSSTTTVAGGRPAATGSNSDKTTLPPETTVPATTTTTRPTTTAPRPVVTPPPTDPPPTDPPVTEPPVPPVIDRYSRTPSTWCRDQRSRRVTFTWSARDGSSASLGPAGGAVAATGLPAEGSWTMECQNNAQGTTTGAVLGSTWVLTVSGPGGDVTGSVTIPQN